MKAEIERVELRPLDHNDRPYTKRARHLTDEQWLAMMRLVVDDGPWHWQLPAEAGESVMLLSPVVPEGLDADGLVHEIEPDGRVLHRPYHRGPRDRP